PFLSLPSVYPITLELVPQSALRSTTPSSPAPHAPYFPTLSLHDALPIFQTAAAGGAGAHFRAQAATAALSRDAAERKDRPVVAIDRKSTRLNSSHGSNAYAVFCLEKRRGVGCGSPGERSGGGPVGGGGQG